MGEGGVKGREGVGQEELVRMGWGLGRKEALRAGKEMERVGCKSEENLQIDMPEGCLVSKLPISNYARIPVHLQSIPKKCSYQLQKFPYYIYPYCKILWITCQYHELYWHIGLCVWQKHKHLNCVYKKFEFHSFTILILSITNQMVNAIDNPNIR